MPEPTPTGTGNVPEDVRQQIINEFLASHPNVLIEPQGDSPQARLLETRSEVIGSLSEAYKTQGVHMLTVAYAPGPRTSTSRSPLKSKT